MNSNDRHWTRREVIAGGLTALPLLLLPQSLSALLMKEQFIHRTVFAMGTTVGIQAYGTDRQHVLHAMTKAFDVLYRYDRLFSVFDPHSTISQINRSAGKAPVSAEPEVMALMEHAIRYSQITGGRFDCTLEPLMRLWGFRNNGRTSKPTDREIGKILDAVGYRNIVINQNESSAGLLHSGASLDLGGIAVGFTVDAMAAVLRKEGITSALINHSGDAYAVGTPPDSAGWLFGIPSPDHKQKFIDTVLLCDKAVSTSGFAESYVEFERIKYGHIFDAVIGSPVEKMLSLSVISESSLESDALSTALFCEPPDSINPDKFGTKLEIVMIDKQLNCRRLK